ncbi:hypothetical protein [Nocardiopsis sp. NPDC006938]|uniref:hypothetical protein n=1 Tax=Nocardiopsis sp. NPDC006938 TaxID=3364337 RepID=UPI00367E0969
MKNQRPTSPPLLLLATLGAGLFLTGCGLLPGGPDDPRDPGVSPVSASPSDDRPSASPDDRAPGGPPSPDAASSPSGTAPDWAAPSFATGWEIQYRADMNLHQATQDGTGCDVVFSQTTGTDQARRDGFEPGGTLDALVENVAERAGSTPVDVPADPYRIVADSGRTHEFETRQVTFDTPDEHRTARMGVLWVDDAELVVSASCPTEAWDEQQFPIAVLVGAASISGA